MKYSGQLFAGVLLVGAIISSCTNQGNPNHQMSQTVPNGIDLAHWKITLPIDKNDDGRPDEFLPDELEKLRGTDKLKPFFYEDEDGALVFYCSKAGDIATTKNSSSPRSELREQLEPGSNNVNWTLDQGGRMEGTLLIAQATDDARFMVMQIHGRLTNEQRDSIGKDDNDAPPLFKIYYNEGQIEIAHKVLKDKSTKGKDLLYKSNWTDAEHYFFSKEIGHEKFNLAIAAERGKLIVTLDDESKEFTDPDLMIWPFENYFKAGNYLTTKSTDASSKVKYYELTVTH